MDYLCFTSYALKEIKLVWSLFYQSLLLLIILDYVLFLHSTVASINKFLLYLCKLGDRTL